MAMIVLEARSALPVRYGSWADWRRDQQDRLPPAPLLALGSAFCAVCWGAGHVYEPAANGEGLIPVVCGTCLGARTVAS